jgi:hypothetical protein
VREDARRVVVDDFDIADEAVRVEALEEVVRQQGVLRDTSSRANATNASTSYRPLPVKIPSSKRSW